MLVCCVHKSANTSGELGDRLTPVGIYATGASGGAAVRKYATVGFTFTEEVQEGKLQSYSKTRTQVAGGLFVLGHIEKDF